MRILAVTSGRWDWTPLEPVVAELEKSHRVLWLKVGKYFSDAAFDTEERLRKTHDDLVLLLGDRYETLAAAGVATVAGIPIAHIHGGETTLGSFDNQIRHAISKLAHIHFVAHEQFKDKLISIGEDPKRIHVVGAPGLDNLVDLPKRKPGKYFVVTYHPETLGETDALPLLEALEMFPSYRIHWTDVNNDPGAETIRTALAGIGFVDWSGEAYWDMCRHAAVVIGNSSSGLIEMPTLEVPTVNVGRRQEGRPCGPSVFNCDNSAADITGAIMEALRYTGPYTNPYGGPGASKKIADILSDIEIDMIKE